MSDHQKSTNQSTKGTGTKSSRKDTATAKTLWEKLAAPFNEDEIEWRAGATNKDKNKCLALPYVTNRAIENRLDEVMRPGGWQNVFERIEGGFICGISLKIDNEWITKYDGAGDSNFEKVKGGISNAMKRAAVQWGIGRYLYGAEATWVACKNVGRGDKPVIVITGTPKLVFKQGVKKVEEMEDVPETNPSEPAEDRAIQSAIKKLKAAETIDELRSIYETLGSLKADPEVMAMKDQLKREFQS